MNKFKIGDIVGLRASNVNQTRYKWEIISQEEADKLHIGGILSERLVYVKDVSETKYGGNGILNVKDLYLIREKSRIPLWL
jgi:hypothetical protein